MVEYSRSERRRVVERSQHLYSMSLFFIQNPRDQYELPAESPHIVTLLGLPPNLLIYLKSLTAIQKERCENERVVAPIAMQNVDPLIYIIRGCGRKLDRSLRT